MSDESERIRKMGAKIRLLADLKVRAERRLDEADAEIARLRAELANKQKDGGNAE